MILHSFSISACAQTVADLSSGCPDVSVLVTSREPLRIPGEVVWRVPALEFPQTEGEDNLQISALRKYPAVELFMDRASASLPAHAFTEREAAAIAQICRHLDGMPLAIELVATRLRALIVEQVLHGLGDRFRLLSEGSRTAPARQ